MNTLRRDAVKKVNYITDLIPVQLYNKDSSDSCVFSRIFILTRTFLNLKYVLTRLQKITYLFDYIVTIAAQIYIIIRPISCDEMAVGILECVAKYRTCMTEPSRPSLQSLYKQKPQTEVKQRYITRS